MQRREINGAEKRKGGCREEKTLYFGATVQNNNFYYHIFNQLRIDYCGLRPI